MKTEFRKSFEKDLKNIKDSNLLERVKLVIEEIENAVDLQEINNFKMMKTANNYYRIRVGNYRIGLSINNDLVTLVRILHRKEIYRYFP
ncbi:type II toxin-antitoxin system RelE/ParE family toxin [Dolichospermum sp. ST_con]|jgi:mRNA interferase RelE/StbE|nr:type II toxin-antitoxin system RelE/ParE family toxin [Dolichospermum sp. ST_con]MDD1420838.1 type II toxin-antitoxin system RelE/ParE family toxin [Dolichospermum sp. ST_sed1]MDD1423048.1 type II toxin-antitoxin system RelE/ParE family toxin [Dolichospermum sp. ST_sed9]MDD1432484.1 type II toxin-antitoxin system RelE/ParE family toxin [Dolichospermum sp. ST_sed6]MDD1436317.1 type II toxin-antitoxin system RelE/ParE family toxin [Dolichospermum sp. ST_sed10]MDD1442396.1 type II toxin-antito